MAWKICITKRSCYVLINNRSFFMIQKYHLYQCFVYYVSSTHIYLYIYRLLCFSNHLVVLPLSLFFGPFTGSTCALFFLESSSYRPYTNQNGCHRVKNCRVVSKCSPRRHFDVVYDFRPHSDLLTIFPPLSTYS